jgi:DNA mismatch repair protein MutL
MISLLPQELINKIAAGEVVERPSSVVKELIENSIDAKANEISIIIDTDLISVEDNGMGIDKEDLLKLFINHSTSKINAIEDLNEIITMGFRGEAIATIAAVSNMEIKSLVGGGGGGGGGGASAGAWGFFYFGFF